MFSYLSLKVFFNNFNYPCLVLLRLLFSLIITVLLEEFWDSLSFRLPTVSSVLFKLPIIFPRGSATYFFKFILLLLKVITLFVD